MRDFGSVFRGLLEMSKWYEVFKHWAIRVIEQIKFG